MISIKLDAAVEIGNKVREVANTDDIAGRSAFRE
jgi:hypothetical protein